MQGYTVSFIEKVRSSDPSKVGVVLGVRALDKNIPVAAIAEHLGVSRMAVYDWFTGRYTPQDRHAEALEEFIEAYEPPTEQPA